MVEQPQAQLEASPEQIAYAKILEKGMLIGLVLLLITFALYVFGIMKPFIHPGDLSQYWSLSVDEYLQQTNIHAGWAWLGMLNYGDFINFIGIAILGGTTIICYMAIVPTLLKNNDKIYAVLALLEVIILTVAASGILGSGGH
jgi:hypothetical protein